MVNENSYAYAIIKKSLEQGVAQGLEQGLETLRESILKLILKRFQGTSESEAKKRLEAIELKSQRHCNQFLIEPLIGKISTTSGRLQKRMMLKRQSLQPSKERR